MTSSTPVRRACTGAAVTAAIALASPAANAATAVRMPNGAIRYYDDRGPGPRLGVVPAPP
jgi:hypothetical protein